MGRPARGSRHSLFFGVDKNPSLATLDSAFQLQEYIALLVRLDPHDVHRIVALPGGGPKTDPADAADAELLLSAEDERPVVDEACWIYEQLRRLAQDLTHPLITTLQLECTRQTCPEMKAGEWLYLCVAHGNYNSAGMEHCCAIDYIVHTLDSATALLNSPRAFPSRISIPVTSHRHFPSLARRLGRIFAHAYHHHRATFESVEAEGALYARFLALARRFDLVPAEFLVIPPLSADADEPELEALPPIPLLTRDSPEPKSTASPRIGGRARTDTMYHSDEVAGVIAEATSPRRMPIPLARTLYTEHLYDVADPHVAETSALLLRDFAFSHDAESLTTSTEILVPGGDPEYEFVRDEEDEAVEETGWHDDDDDEEEEDDAKEAQAQEDQEEKHEDKDGLAAGDARPAEPMANDTTPEHGVPIEDTLPKIPRDAGLEPDFAMPVVSVHADALDFPVATSPTIILVESLTTTVVESLATTNAESLTTTTAEALATTTAESPPADAPPVTVPELPEDATPEPPATVDDTAPSDVSQPHDAGAVKDIADGVDVVADAEVSSTEDPAADEEVHSAEDATADADVHSAEDATADPEANSTKVPYADAEAHSTLDSNAHVEPHSTEDTADAEAHVTGDYEVVQPEDAGHGPDTGDATAGAGASETVLGQ